MLVSAMDRWGVTVKAKAMMGQTESTGIKKAMPKVDMLLETTSLYGAYRKYA